MQLVRLHLLIVKYGIGMRVLLFSDVFLWAPCSLFVSLTPAVLPVLAFLSSGSSDFRLCTES